MKVGDLVCLTAEYFTEFNENVGIILETIKTPDGFLYKVAWDDGHIAWLHEIELEVVSGRKS